MLNNTDTPEAFGVDDSIALDFSFPRSQTFGIVETGGIEIGRYDNRCGDNGASEGATAGFIDTANKRPGKCAGAGVIVICRLKSGYVLQEVAIVPN